MAFDWILAPPQGNRPELIDLPDTPWDDVLAGMADVRRINAVTGAYPILLGTLERLAPPPGGRPWRVLDVATGLADIPKALVDRARTRSTPIQVTGLDLNARILEMARTDLDTAYPEIDLVEADATAMPFPDGAFDAAMCHLALHHLPPTLHVGLFREMNRVIRPGGVLLMGDLERSHLNIALSWPFLAAVASRIGQHDGRVSLENALAAGEWQALIAETGLGYLQRRWLAPPAQVVIAGIKP